MKILIGCEVSGRIRDAFCRAGADAYSCDVLRISEIPQNLQEAQTHPHKHIAGDLLEVAARGGWDMMIAHPPCTTLANSGVRWLYNPDNTENQARWQRLREDAAFYRSVCQLPVFFKAIENPVQHQHALNLHGMGKADQFVQPSWFGSTESKRTGFKLYNLPPLVRTSFVPASDQSVWKQSPGPWRWLYRSLVPHEMINAMVSQWLPIVQSARPQQVEHDVRRILDTPSAKRERSQLSKPDLQKKPAARAGTALKARG